MVRLLGATIVFLHETIRIKSMYHSEKYNVDGEYLFIIHYSYLCYKRSYEICLKTLKKVLGTTTKIFSSFVHDNSTVLTQNSD